MEETSEMEVEEEREHQPNHDQNSSKRLGLKSSIQTNFGDDYVFQIVPKNDWSAMAVSLSNNVVKLYSPVTGQYYGDCKGHSSTINSISFSSPSGPHVLHSCSSDGTVRAWDTRTFQQISCITSGSSEVFSFSFGGLNDNLLAAGCESKILLWDWRNIKQVACLEESHVDDVTQVRFIPNHKSNLVSASADGLVCIFDCSGNINEEDQLDSVINVGTSIGKVGFFGDAYEKLWCLTNIETMSVWDWKDGKCEANIENARAQASDSWQLDPVDYFVDCLWSKNDDLWVIGGASSGSIGCFPVSYKGRASIGSPEAVLAGGHADVVRSALPMSSMWGGPVQDQGFFGWTGGEDGRLCCWTADTSPEANRSWVSSSLVMRSPLIGKRIRPNPY